MANKNLREEIKLIQVENYLSVVTKILKLAKECYEYSIYLDTPTSLDEFSFIIASPSFNIFKIITARTAVIELSKLYGRKGNKYSFITFLNSLINGEYGNKFKQDKGLKKWVDEFNKFQPTINKIIALRDKAFAHTDLEHEIADLQKVAYEDIRKLIEISETFISFMNKEFYNRTTYINTSTNDLEANVGLILKARYEEE